ncbi:flagellar basal body rod C-terminal domain-containing protein [Pseudodesulfovibrio sp. zrk46]|uniref:flagellar hook-associated protein FlgK n=1 Tax=Pseudodesulfovibrio sp. zrk46 TaxID=2725288 RepID=UPI0014490E2A|nr:flagellar basal body rod C-terminal domain-containing protein [Pseudodesulfovibrio sp. zrk46]QJB57223.1 flagellar biosynthesis protein FlgK [Pseudodesulfovibrio sp. zrk46]
MLNTTLNIGQTALQNAQVGVNNASNNIANADTEGYQKTEVVQETSSSITSYGLTVGTGADATAIIASFNEFVEAQYLDASADLAMQNAAIEYLTQLDSLLNQDEDEGISVALNEYLDAWNELVTDPDSLSAREALLGETESLVYALNSTMDTLENTVDAIDDEIQTEVDEANQIIDDIAALNVSIAANPDDTQAISERNQLIRDLDEIIGVDTIYQSNGQVTILTEEGNSLVDGSETHHLAYSDARTTESLVRDSTYTGEIAYSGTSGDELLIEFVSNGPDGTAQFKVSTDGGQTWLEDDGNTMLYTADDEDNSVEINGVEVWFEDSGGDHAEGDRYTIVPKSGLYWESGDGDLVNITPMTDDSGDAVSGRVCSGSLAGLFTTRDDVVMETMDSLDDFAEALIWETNVEHSQGAGLEHHTGLTASYSVDDSSAMLSNAGLNYGDNIQSGSLELVTYDSDDEVATTAVIAIDPATDSLDDIVADINTAFGGELTASVNSDGQLILSAGTDMEFEIAGDSSNLLAALGVNTYYTGTDASSIAVDSYVANDTSHINTGVLGDDYTMASGSNEVATAMYNLSSETITVGNSETTLSSSLSALVSAVGSAASSAELKQTYAATSAEYLYDQQASTSEVNVDEELVSLTKYQQAYQAAAEIITVSREMMQTVLDMV